MVGWSVSESRVDAEVEVGGQGRALKAKGSECGEGVPPFPHHRGGVCKGGSALCPENFFLILRSKWRIFVDSVLSFVFLSP